jgi:nitrile hydratase
MALWFGGAWIADEIRHSIETMKPGCYLEISYYEKWMYFMENLLVQKEIVTWDEIHAGQLITSGEGSELVSKILSEECWPLFLRGGSTALDPIGLPAFEAGDKVRCKMINPPGHTRLPRYARGRLGTIIAYHGSFDFSDTRAEGEIGNSQHLYGVCFNGAELWGADGDAHDHVYLDLFESYLEPKDE